MKNITGKLILSLSMLLLAGVLFTQCTQEEALQPREATQELSLYGYGPGTGDCLACIDNLPKSSISDAERQGLLFMREEEKLARDVYRYFSARWKASVFDRIAVSEQQHMDAILVLLNRYQIPDPVGDHAAGIFVNERLQFLYDSLTAVGRQSELKALYVGAAIEEIDLIDLEYQLTTVVDNADIRQVYQNLASASENHLRAFVRNIEVRSVTYEPQYLSPEAYYEAITKPAMGGGTGRRRGRT